MAELFNRDFSVQIADRLIRARADDDDIAQPTLRVQFKVEKGDRKTPNSANVTVYNLSDASRSSIQEKGATTIIEAGYVGSTQQIFKGDLIYASTRRDGPDWVTEFQSGDGAARYRGKRINESFPRGAKLKQVVKTAAEAIGVDLGNTVDRMTQGGFRGSIDEFARGLVLQGKATTELEKLLKSIGLGYSIQDGALQILGGNETTQAAAVKISPATGMVGSPEVGEKGIVNVRTLLQGLIKPGLKVDIEAKEFTGFFKCIKVTHTGDTWGGDWYTDLEAKPL